MKKEEDKCIFQIKEWKECMIPGNQAIKPKCNGTTDKKRCPFWRKK